jgi:uncharacterized protein YdeI (YjbR/CyaY-like superfamily)
MNGEQDSRLKREHYPMPTFVRDALRDNGLMDAYQARPPYQQNDYVGWITRAKKPETQMKRMTQMLDELSAGDRYMKMSYRAK